MTAICSVYIYIKLTEICTAVCNGIVPWAQLLSHTLACAAQLLGQPPIDQQYNDVDTHINRHSDESRTALDSLTCVKAHSNFWLQLPTRQ
jgi:hypothetical protein